MDGRIDDVDTGQRGLSSERPAAVLAPPYAVAAAVCGPHHRSVELPCQDAFAAIIGSNRVVVAVADGLGSARHSHVGASISSQAAVADATARLERGPTRLRTTCRASITSARKQLEAHARETGEELRSYASTLLVVCASGDSLAVAHIGDGAVVGDVGGRLELLSGPGSSEYANEVEPLTSETWRANVRVSGIFSGVTAFVAFTDGCQRAALLKAGTDVTPYPGFLSPLLQHARAASDPATASEELATLLDGPKMTEHSEDDKTLVIAILQGHA